MKKNDIKKLLQESLEKTLNEGVYDRGSLKCFIMAGGPGSGKSFVIKNTFGTIETAKLNTLTGLGLKIWNTDLPYVAALEKHGVSPASLELMAPRVFKYYTTKFRDKAVAPIKRWLDVLKNDRIGIIIDGTGKDTGKIKHQKEGFEAAGYDVYMMFVSTPLEIAQQRNAKRDRRLPSEMVADLWKQSEETKATYKQMFGQRFFEVDRGDPNASFKDIQSKIDRIMTLPVKNPIGQEWIKAELDIKNRLRQEIPNKTTENKIRKIIRTEAYVGQLRDKIEIVVNVDKTDHATDRQSRHGEGEEIPEADIMATANKAIDQIAKLLMFDDINIDEAIHIHDRSSDLNLVCQIKQAGDKLKLVVITVMRKSYFVAKTGTRSITV